MNTTQIWWMGLAMVNAFAMGLQVSRMLSQGSKFDGTDVFWAALLVVLIVASTAGAVTA
jgi:hypothetical protein